MIALDQTIDPIRSFFLPFSFSEWKKSRKQTPREAFGVASPVAASDGDYAEKGLAYRWISGPILCLVIHVAVDSIIFSLVAGMSLGAYYLVAQLTEPQHPVTIFLKTLISVMLICDLILLLVSFTKIAIKTVRDA
jgi:hypothetical protein